MRMLATALLTLLLSAALTAQNAAPRATRTPTPQELKTLRTELIEMNRLDQLHRKAVSWGTTDPKELARLDALDDEANMAETKRRWREGVKLPKAVADELMAKQRKLDKANLDQLIEWTSTFGYPDPERLGIDAPTPVGVLLHAQTEWFEPLAELLHAEAKAGRMNAKEFAAVSDRKAQHAGRMQLYGMCQRFDATSNSILPPEIEDIDKTNAARAELGLPPLERYLIVAPKRPQEKPAAPHRIK
jgi:hypothetical protein